MVLRVEAESRREPVDRLLQASVVEGHEPPAAVAQEVMMVLARGIHQFVAGHAVADLDRFDEMVVCQQLEHSIHARPTHRPLSIASLAEGILDLQRAQCAPLPREQADHLVPRRAPMVPGGVQDRSGMSRPLLGSDRVLVCVRHRLKITDLAAGHKSETQTQSLIVFPI